MELIPPQLFTGLGVITILVLSWWMLMRGHIHTDTEFQFVVKENEALKQALTESQAQNRDLIEANRTVVHVLRGFTAAAEGKP
jgi:hypothetical protein